MKVGYPVLKKILSLFRYFTKILGHFETLTMEDLEQLYEVTESFPRELEQLTEVSGVGWRFSGLMFICISKTIGFHLFSKNRNG